jgi:hypothetical protein
MERKQIKEEYTLQHLHPQHEVIENSLQQNSQFMNNQQYLTYYQNVLSTNREMVYPFPNIQYENMNDIVIPT